MRPKAVIFDLDGTLVDTLEDITAAVNAAFAARGFAPVGAGRVKPLVGWGHRRLIASLVGEGDPALVEELAAAQKAAYEGAPAAASRPYPGVRETLEKLSALRIDLAVLSNKPDSIAKSILGILFPPALFREVRGQQEGFPPKPDPGQCLDLLASMGAAPGEALFVGDSAVDVQTARAAGTRVVSCLWGFRPEEELRAARPDYLAARPLDILSIIDTMGR